MAATVEARRLTEAHRLAQHRLGVQTVTASHRLWRLLDLNDLDGSFDRWLAATMPIVRAQRSISARLASSYVSTFKALEVGASAASPIVLAEQVDAAAVTTSLLVTGPVHVKSALARGVPLVRAGELGAASSARAAMRHTLGGGRDTIDRTVHADDQALGWARVTAADPCYFCSMLASRGPVYKTNVTAGFEAHDACSCIPEPVYRDDAEWPSGAREFQRLWERSTIGHSGKDAINAYRRAIEGGVAV